jgi:hypothetical protein
MRMSVEVRTANLDDIDWILGQLKNFADFYGTRKNLFGDDAEYNKNLITNLIERHVFLIAESIQFGRIGFIAGSLEPHLYNPDITVLNECFWWVDEKHRGSKAGLLLLNSFVHFGKRAADWIWMTLETDSPVQDRSLIRRGFKEQERSFLMECV